MKRTPKAPGWRTIEFLTLLLIIALSVWAYHTPIDQVVTASGEVIPSGKIKVIQHLEGGIIEKIHVTPGESVKAGSKLITLNLASGGYNLKELQAKLDGLILSDTRLNAEISGAVPNFPQPLQTSRPTLIEAELKILEARRTELASTLAVFDSQKRLRNREIEEARSRERSLAKQGITKQKELDIITDTFKRKLTSELKLLAAQSAMEEIHGELEVTRKTILTAQESLQEIEARATELKAIFQRTAREQRHEVQQKIIQTQEQLKRATEQKSRTIIRSPISGEVKNMRHHTIGGVAEAAEPLMEIVPLEEELVIEARLSPINRGYVTENKPARIKISAYDFIRYGTLQGQVKTIAADTEVDHNGETYYLVTVRTDRHYLGDKSLPYPIKPGMEATVDIHAGTQTVLEYLIRPVLKLRHDAFREP